MAIDINNATLGNIKPLDGDRTERRPADSHKPADASSATVDKVELSADAQTLQKVERQLENTDSFDQAKVDAIKDALSKGEYPIDNERLASKFYELESQLEF